MHGSDTSKIELDATDLVFDFMRMLNGNWAHVLGLSDTMNATNCL